jgi:hypothetical protein
MKKINIKRALETVLNLYDEWGLSVKDWVLVNDWAYEFQDYKLKIGRLKAIDTIVNKNRWPWKTQGKARVIPPKDSKALKQIFNFVEKSGYWLDILLVSPKVIKGSSLINYKLPSGNRIQIMEVCDMTKAWYQNTLQKQTERDVGKEEIEFWKKKLKIIKQVAKNKHNLRLVQLCQELIEIEHRKSTR